MEEIDKLPTPKPVERQEASQDTSIWRPTTTAAVALTVLATCGIAINVHNPVEAIGNLLFSVPVTFLFWWMICTFILWLWRAIFGG